MARNSTQDKDLEKITEVQKIAKFYGFRNITPPSLEKQDFEVVRSFDQSFHPAEKAAILRMYFTDKTISSPQSNMFYCEKPFPGLKKLTGRKNPNRLEGIAVSLGSYKSVCECLTIQMSVAILKYLGYKNLEVHVNSVGDKDSISEFQKKLNFFIRKNFSSFPADLKQALKTDPFAVRRECVDGQQDTQIECPASIDFLSESSRLHFKEVLEFLELMEIPYQINHGLIGDPAMGSETVFAVKSNGEELANGFRFNRLAKKIGYKKDVPGTVLNFSVRLKKKLKKVRAKTIKPQFYLVQFGPEAKLKSFLILEELYKAGASVSHSLIRDKLGGQIGAAETSEIPYILLIGQKEALENSVIIRNNATRAQEIVPICELAAKVKELI